MAGLADMEELIGKVDNADVANYLREAFACYGAGAYRACIVLTFAALFEDIRLKTMNVGKVNASARSVSTAIEALAAGQKPFENQLVDQLKSNDLISELQSQTLKQIIAHRNKAAHPSGHIASAEEARYVFREAIDKFLSQPVLSTSHAVDAIIDELSSSNYFPSRQLSEVSKVVNAAVQQVHKSAFQQLVERLVKELKNTAVETNARLFLQGLVLSDAGIWSPLVRAALFEKRSSDLDFGPAIFMLLAVDANLFVDCTAISQSRIVKIAENMVGTTDASVSLNQTRHPLQVLRSIVEQLPAGDLLKFDAFVDKAIGKHWSNVAVVGAVKGSPDLLQRLFKLYLEKAGSSLFDKANRFAEVLKDLDDELAEVISEREAFELLQAVTKAADFGAWTSERIASRKFSASPKLREKAKAYCLGPGLSPEEALEASDFREAYLETNDEE
ncbi:MAG: hypothetical protein ACK4ZU_17125 [Allorhizobium sp.]